MNETVLRDFFIGAASAADLGRDMAEAVIEHAPGHTSQTIESVDGEFEVRSEHLVRVCDSVIAGALVAADLEKIGFCLIASDFFIWDGDNEDGARVAETAHDWASPEVNYQLTAATTQKFRVRLLFGRDEFTASDHYRKEANQPVQTTRAVARPERLT
jgi:hypothetical protein